MHQVISALDGFQPGFGVSAKVKGREKPSSENCLVTRIDREPAIRGPSPERHFKAASEPRVTVRSEPPVHFGATQNIENKELRILSIFTAI